MSVRSSIYIVCSIDINLDCQSPTIIHVIPLKISEILFVIPMKSTFSHASRSRSRKFGIRSSQINLKCLRFIVLQVPREFPIAQLIFSMLHIYIVLPMYVYMGFIIRYEQIWFVHTTSKNHSLQIFTWHFYFPQKPFYNMKFDINDNIGRSSTLTL